MIQHHTLDTPPTEIRFPRHQIIAEVARNETTANIGKASQSQNPGKEEMDRPVPNRGANDKGNRKINEELCPYVASLTPVKARMRYENAHAAHEQPKHAQHDDPVSDTDNRAVALHGPRVIEWCFNSRFVIHYSLR